MDARTYLDKYGPEHTAKVCKRANTNLAYFRQLANKHRFPSRKLAKTLVQETKGELTIEDLLSE
jgi:hypothetical protein